MVVAVGMSWPLLRRLDLSYVFFQECTATVAEERVVSLQNNDHFFKK